MTTFGIFVPKQPEIHREALQAFAQGLEHRLLKYEVHCLEEGYRECDVLVTFGVGKRATGRGRRIARMVAEHKSVKGLKKFSRRTHLVIERGFVRREEYYMVGCDGLNGRANYFNRRCSGKRWDELGVTVAPWRKSGRHIVLCGQVPWDASVQDTDHVAWCRDTAVQLAALTDRPIRFRPHPMQPDAIDMSDCPVQISENATLEGDLQDAWAVVTYNSNAGVEATLAGIPAFAADAGAMGYPILNHDLTLINSPLTPCRRQWLANLAYTQWTFLEMAQGLAIEHVWCRRHLFRSRHWWNVLAGRYPSFDPQRDAKPWRLFEQTQRPAA